jgi:hypothetical protein
VRSIGKAAFVPTATAPDRALVGLAVREDEFSEKHGRAGVEHTRELGSSERSRRRTTFESGVPKLAQLAQMPLAIANAHIYLSIEKR